MNLSRKFKRYINFFVLKSLNYFPLGAKTKFSLIHKWSLWNSDESKSGRGSELLRGSNFITGVTRIIEDFDISTVLDVPCGDVNLMRNVFNNLDINYLGVDIVEDIIVQNKKRFSDLQNVEFRSGDARYDKLEEFNLVIARDFLFHLSRSDIKLFLDNILNSRSKYLLVTSHALKSDFQSNNDIKTGDFRYLDLFKPPFNFPKPVAEFFDYEDDNVRNMMYLVEVDQLTSTIKSL